MTQLRIDLNADLGEEYGDDRSIFPFLSSANIACGAHAGGPEAMETALTEAAALGVCVGAHVSYEDREGFGRRPLDVPADQLQRSLETQIQRLQELAARHRVAIRYVKPHGALYHRVAEGGAHAQALVSAVNACNPDLELLVPFSNSFHAIARPLVCRHEFFADRGYHFDGRLVDRSETSAHIVSVEGVVARTLRWVRDGIVTSVEWRDVRIDAESICIHGDSPAAVAVARELHQALKTEGCRIFNWMIE